MKKFGFILTSQNTNNSRPLLTPAPFLLILQCPHQACHSGRPCRHSRPSAVPRPIYRSDSETQRTQKVPTGDCSRKLQHCRARCSADESQREQRAALYPLGPTPPGGSPDTASRATTASTARFIILRARHLTCCFLLSPMCCWLYVYLSKSLRNSLISGLNAARLNAAKFLFVRLG